MDMKLSQLRQEAWRAVVHGVCRELDTIEHWNSNM